MEEFLLENGFILSGLPSTYTRGVWTIYLGKDEIEAWDDVDVSDLNLYVCLPRTEDSLVAIIEDIDLY